MLFHKSARKDREYFQLLLKNTPNIVIILDGNGLIEFCSDVFIKTVGSEKYKYLQGLHFSELFAFFDSDSTKEIAQKTFEKIQLEKEIAIGHLYIDFSGQGKKCRYLLQSIPLLDDRNVFQGVEVYLLEEAGLLRAEADERVQAMLDATPLACSIRDKDGKVIDCNEEAVRYFGAKSKAELLANINKTNPEFQNDGEASISKQKRYDATVLRTGNLRFPWLHLSLQGEELPADVTLRKVSLKNAAFAAYSRDLREVEASQKRLRETEELLRAMMDAAPMACTIRDADNNILECNQKTAQMLGVSQKADVNSLFKNFTAYPEFQEDGTPSRSRAKAMIDEILEKGYVRYKWIYRTVAGEPFPVEMTGVRIQWREGYRIAVFSRDLREAP
ncbi:PAS domain-containing protein [Leadbettera azotonutricia]|nr:PAS domain-containing protein [Leadbettera azotonutricia]